MNKAQLKQILSQHYSRENWRTLLGNIFKHASFLQSPQPIPVSHDIVKSFLQFGNVRLEDGSNLALFEVRVKDNVKIPKIGRASCRERV